MKIKNVIFYVLICLGFGLVMTLNNLTNLAPAPFESELTVVDATVSKISFDSNRDLWKLNLNSNGKKLVVHIPDFFSCDKLKINQKYEFKVYRPIDLFSIIKVWDVSDAKGRNLLSFEDSKVNHNGSYLNLLIGFLLYGVLFPLGMCLATLVLKPLESKFKKVST